VTHAELILYATPRGPLADALADVFDRIAETRATTAQEYPPHCTLTGFFHRPTRDVSRIVDELKRSLLDVGTMPSNAVQIAEIHCRDDWVGLELQSPWLTHLTERFVHHHALRAGDDALRPKEWLHLSIAYGIDDNRHAAREIEEVDFVKEVQWDVAIWQRLADGQWNRLPSKLRASRPR
jgi:hypothetical protein